MVLGRIYDAVAGPPGEFESSLGEAVYNVPIIPGRSESGEPIYYDENEGSGEGTVVSVGDVTDGTAVTELVSYESSQASKAVDAVGSAGSSAGSAVGNAVGTVTGSVGGGLFRGLLSSAGGLVLLGILAVVAFFAIGGDLEQLS